MNNWFKSIMCALAVNCIVVLVLMLAVLLIYLSINSPVGFCAVLFILSLTVLTFVFKDTLFSG